MAGYALLVGIDEYETHTKLHTPVRDAEAIDKLLSTDYDGRSRWETEVLAGAKKAKRVTYTKFSDSLRAMLRDAENDKGHFLFYFAGHGDREDELQGHRLFVQGDKEKDADAAINLAGTIDMILGANVKSATVMLDCCYAGSADRDVPIRKDRAILTSSSHEQEAADGAAEHSPFGAYVIDALNGSAASLDGRGHHHRALRARAHAVRPPRPAGPAADQPGVRAGGAAHSRAALRDASSSTRIFKRSPDTVVRLHQAHEGVGRPFQDNPAHQPTQAQLDFDQLKAFRNLGLIESEDDEDLYWLAVRESQDGKVWLSPLGNWYMRAHKLKWL